MTAETLSVGCGPEGWVAGVLAAVILAILGFAVWVSIATGRSQ